MTESGIFEADPIQMYYGSTIYTFYCMINIIFYTANFVPSSGFAVQY